MGLFRPQLAALRRPQDVLVQTDAAFPLDTDAGDAGCERNHRGYLVGTRRDAMKQNGRPSPRSSNGSTYRNVFIQRVHQLLALGYSQLTPASFARSQEEVITGELKNA